MNPTISNISEDGPVYKFTLSGLNVSLANALRRIILSEIPVNAIITEVSTENKCNILINTTRLHNEILKHRLSCIPIHMKELDVLPEKYQLEIDEKNDTDQIKFVTTEHFKIRNKANGNYLTKDEMKRIFPPCEKTNYYIDFARLRPKIGDTIPGEQLKLVADFSVSNAKSNSMFNVVSLCAYGNTLDLTKIESKWDSIYDKLVSEGATKEEIDVEKQNYRILDAQRQYVENSFDFIIQSIGIYENKEIVKLACQILNEKLLGLVSAIESRIVPINLSESTMDNCYDITLENEDYTIGKIIEYFIYEKHFVEDKTVSYIGFKKFHPHSPDSVVRIAFLKPADEDFVSSYLREACIDGSNIFKKIYAMF
uniref:DNA-directed RNA polymerase RpoA/D/Rpb3-type domain-containing protein n=1 Tax=viral metagenome TaxID=1070528 RepID=A0A6C0DQX6_9ZZZZ